MHKSLTSVKEASTWFPFLNSWSTNLILMYRLYIRLIVYTLPFYGSRLFFLLLNDLIVATQKRLLYRAFFLYSNLIKIPQ